MPTPGFLRHHLLQDGDQVVAEFLFPFAGEDMLDDEDSALCVRAERAVSRGLGGSCQIPLGAHATRDGDRLQIVGLVAAPDGKQVVRAAREGMASQPEMLGEALANDLRERGAKAIIDAL